MPTFISRNDDGAEDLDRLARNENAIHSPENLKRLRECGCLDSPIEEKKPPIGTGARFKSLKAKVAKGGASDPAAVAASIGRKKYGSKKFAKLSAKGRRKAREAGTYGTLAPSLQAAGRSRKKKKVIGKNPKSLGSGGYKKGPISQGRTGGISGTTTP